MLSAQPTTSNAKGKQRASGGSAGTNDFLERNLKRRGHVAAVARDVVDSLTDFAAPKHPLSTSSFDTSTFAKSKRAFEETAVLRALGGDEETNDQAFRIANNYSVVKILLSITDLQSRIIDFLIEKIEEFMHLDIPDNAPLTENLPLLLLHQFRFMDHVANPDLLTTKLVHLLDATSKSASTLTSNPREVTCVVLDTLGTIGVPSNMLNDIVNTVVDLLNQAEIDGMPVALKFLLQTTSADTIGELIPRIREKLDVDAIAEVIRGQDSGNTDVTLIFDSLKMGISRQKHVLDAWLKHLSSLDRIRDHKPIDLIVMVLLRQDLQNQKKIDTLIKSKIKEGLMSPDLVTETFGQYFVGMQQYFPTMLSLCEMLVREGVVYHLAAVPMYCSSFTVFDAQFRQQLVGCLIAHIGSGVQHEVDCALDILLKLTVQNPEGVLRFSIFVKGLLDYLDQLSINQIRVLYEIFATLALNKPLEEDDLDGESEITFESGLLSDMRIIVRKQLGSNDPKFKQMGVLGAISLIKRMASTSAVKESAISGSSRGGMSSRSAANSSSQSLGTVSCSAAINLVIQIFRSCEQNSIQSFSLLFDELSYMVSHSDLHPRFLEWINESFVTLFVAQFVVSESDITSSEADDTKTEVWFRLDKKQASEEEMVPETVTDVVEATILEYSNQESKESSDDDEPNFVNVFPLSQWHYSMEEKRQIPEKDEDDETDAVGNNNLSQEKQLLMLLPSSFKFLQSVEWQRSGSLEEIGVVLDLGLVMFDKKLVEDIPLQAKTEVCCSALFAAINFFREIINAFCKRSALDSTDSMEFCGIRCLERIKHIVKLQAILERLIPSVPRWAPIGFFRNGDSNEDEIHLESNPTDDDQEDLAASAVYTATAGTAGKKSQTAAKSQKSKKGKQKAKIPSRFTKFAELKPILREIEVDVFNLLSCSYLKLPSPEVIAAGVDESENEAIIQFPELLFLFSELQSKLEFLTGSNPKVNPRFTGLLGSGSVGFSNLQRMGVADVIKSIVAVVPSLCVGLESVYSELRKAHEDAEKEEAELKERQYIQTLWSLYDVILSCFNLLFQWSDLTGNQIQFLNVIKVIASRGNPDVDIGQRSQSTQDRQQLICKLCKDTHDYFIAFKKFAPSLMSAVLLVKVLMKLQKSVSDETLDSMKTEVGDLAKYDLDFDWIDKKGKNDCIAFLLQVQIENAQTPFGIISEYIHRAFKAFLGGDGEVCVKYPLLSKDTFPIFFKIIFVELVVTIEKSDPPKSPSVEYLSLIQKMAVAFGAAVELTKSFKDVKEYGIVLRYSKSFVQSFVRRIFPVLGRGLKKHRAEVISVCKAMQTGTRMLQVLANECKAKKETTLLTYIPPLRKALEAFIFEVKKILVDNELGDVFYMANLKHRNMRGETISSQIDQSEDEQDNESEQSEVDEIEIPLAKPNKKSQRPATPMLDNEEESSNESNRYNDEIEEDEVEERETTGQLQHKDKDEEEEEEEVPSSETIEEEDNETENPKHSVVNQKRKEVPESEPESEFSEEEIVSTSL
ncbi:hypothetical protein BCR33DRAFT_719084 [Rhizoclosmatium globosum]|uniref:Fanconi anemia group D2 protein n=1 Tax=Rhizoclosmatium globosum TaxID=329046 RepID=A0A1Y2C1S1_9FUNG|nr:hypothetical protein BCR33DRAFT_719084 [Rhizoclosmatium globosum]|eukprot:ORY40978.1 hypothetical protein BCR33DRAFT_719084 [Rhizoclosmatium globosum]